MTLSEKLSCSEIVAIKEVNNSAYGIKPKSQRIKKYIFFILLAAFTIATKFIFKKINDWDVSYLFLSVNLVCLFILTILDGHQRKYNHMIVYQVTNFISKVCKTIIFVFAFFVAYGFFNRFYEQIVGEEFWKFYSHTLFKGDIEGYLNAHGITHGRDFITVSGQQMQYSDVQIKLVMFWVSIVTAAPAILFLISTEFKLFFKIIGIIICLLIPIYNLIYFFKWFFATNITFYHYVPKEGDDTKTIIEVRRITDGRNGIRARQIFLHFIIVLVIVGLGVAIYYSTKDLYNINQLKLFTFR